MIMNTAIEHQSVLLKESIDQLAIKPSGLYVDGTFGRGGHSLAILQALGSEGRLVAFDKDPAAIQYAHQHIKDPRFTIVHASFAQMQTVLTVSGLMGKVDGILLDLGVSSPQLNEAERGFSFMRDGPLDMRMNTADGINAAAWLQTVPETELATVIFEYGEERFSRRIAKAIVQMRATKAITTTKQLADLVAEAVPMRERGKHPATRTFQAIRIFINKELEELELALQQSLEILKVGGRLAVISFHSLEDRRVKHYFRQQATSPILPRNLPLKQSTSQLRLKVIGKAIKPSETELQGNVRARSAVLRTAEKLS